MIPLAIMAGGAVGSIARWAVAIGVARVLGAGFPFGTVLINICGSALIGWYAGRTGPLGHHPAPEALRAFVMIGFCGGFTTFSSFSLQTMELLRGGYPGRAVANVGVSVALCLLGTYLGLRLSQS